MLIEKKKFFIYLTKNQIGAGTNNGSISMHWYRKWIGIRTYKGIDTEEINLGYIWIVIAKIKEE